MVQDEEKFGEWLRHWRGERGHTQEEVGRAIGVSKQHISNLERGQVHYQSGSQARASIEVVDKLAKFLGRPVSEARDAAGYGLGNPGSEPATKAETVEEALRYAMFFKQKNLTPEDIERLRPLLQVVDREVERLKGEE